MRKGRKVPSEHVDAPPTQVERSRSRERLPHEWYTIIFIGGLGGLLFMYEAPHVFDEGDVGQPWAVLLSGVAVAMMLFAAVSFFLTGGRGSR